jgi:N6-adenosine-specific RNA methylase IME4
MAEAARGDQPDDPTMPDVTRRFRCIVVDPPWEYPEGFNARSIPYRTMSLDEIRALPVDCLLMREGYVFMWTTNKYLEAGFSVLRAWGCTPRQTLTWCNPPGGVGLGGMFTTNTEFVIIGQRISEKSNARTKNTTGMREKSSWFQWQKRGHSEKPEEFYSMIERVCLGPYLEMFARDRSPMFSTREGWDVWGDQCAASIELFDG